MNQYGFFKVATAVPKVKVGDISFNTKEIKDAIYEAANQGVELLVFPELSLTSYTCADLFLQERLLDEAVSHLLELVSATADINTLAVVGLPLRADGALINAAVAFQNGTICAIVPKVYLPNYAEFQEQRWFISGANLSNIEIELGGETYRCSERILLINNNVNIAIEICEDLWVPIPRSSISALNGADIIVNLSASNELIGKYEYLRTLIQQQSARCISAYVYASAGYGESSTDLVFGGNAIIAENGAILNEGKRFAQEEQLITSEIDINRIRYERRRNTSFAQNKNYHLNKGSELDAFKIPFTVYDNDNLKLTRKFSTSPFVPNEGDALSSRCEEILNIQAAALVKRIEHTNAQSLILGISGGLDSTLALIVAVKAVDNLHMERSRILGVTMPGFGTTGRTYNNALGLMQALEVSSKEISIKDACIQHFKDIEHDISVLDVTYENSQARERTQLLMDLANKHNGLVIGTGDMSELALGWATYNGDHMSMYGVNVGIPKTLVKYIVQWYANQKENIKVSTYLLDIIDTPISPELIPADDKGNIVQKTEDLVGPYELHDFFLYHFLRFGSSPKKILYLAKYAFAERYDAKTILHWLRIFIRRFFNQQFKRNCLPDGPKVGSVGLSPRGDWRMPSDAVATLWIQELEEE